MDLTVNMAWRMMTGGWIFQKKNCRNRMARRRRSSEMKGRGRTISRQEKNKKMSRRSRQTTLSMVTLHHRLHVRRAQSPSVR